MRIFSLPHWLDDCILEFLQSTPSSRWGLDSEPSETSKHRKTTPWPSEDLLAKRDRTKLKAQCNTRNNYERPRVSSCQQPPQTAEEYITSRERWRPNKNTKWGVKRCRALNYCQILITSHIATLLAVSFWKIPKTSKTIRLSTLQIVRNKTSDDWGAYRLYVWKGR